MAILLLYYPYGVLLATSYVPNGITPLHIGMSAFFCGLFLILFIPGLTARLLRGRRHWAGAILVRLGNLIILLLTLIVYYVAATSSKVTLSSLMIPGHEAEYKIGFAIVLMFFLVLFVLPGLYIQKLLTRHEIATGTYDIAKDTARTISVRRWPLNLSMEGKRPKWVYICVSILAVELVVVSISDTISAAYPSPRAIELFHTYGMVIFLFSTFALISINLFVSGHKFGVSFTQQPARGLMFAAIMTLLGWIIPYGFFHNTLPAYFQYVGDSEIKVKNFVISGELPYENERRCRRGARIIDPLQEDPYQQKVCGIPEIIYRDLGSGSNLRISTTKTEMGYRLGAFLVPK